VGDPFSSDLGSPTYDEAFDLSSAVTQQALADACVALEEQAEKGHLATSLLSCWVQMFQVRWDWREREGYGVESRADGSSCAAGFDRYRRS
jgi:hypothetical protein